MSLSGTVINGQIVLDEPASLAEGTRVEVTPTAPQKTSLGTLLQFAGVVDDLPEDMARNHDHYRLGVPKR